MTTKEKQRELIIEIMKADEHLGIYDEPIMKQTAVDYLFEKLWDEPKDKLTWYKIAGDAKDMEKEQMGNTWVDSRIADKGYDYIGKQKSFEEYYNETYE